MKFEWEVYETGKEVDLQLTATSPQERVLLSLLADRKVNLLFSNDDDNDVARLDIEFRK